MSDEKPPRDVRNLTAEEYRDARAELMREARKAEAEADQARVQRAVEAKYSKDSKK